MYSMERTHGKCVTHGGSEAWFILYEASWHKYAVTRIHFIILFGPTVAPASGAQCTVHDTRRCVASQIHHQLNAATVKGKTPFHSTNFTLKTQLLSSITAAASQPTADNTAATGRPWELGISYVSDLKHSKVKVRSVLFIPQQFIFWRHTIVVDSAIIANEGRIWLCSSQRQPVQSDGFLSRDSSLPQATGGTGGTRSEPAAATVRGAHRIFHHKAPCKFYIHCSVHHCNSLK